MKAFPVVVKASDNLDAILDQMSRQQTTTAFVEEDGDRFLGVLLEGDVKAALEVSQLNARSLVNNDLTVISPDARLEALVPITAASDRPIPVVNEDNRLLGYVDRTLVMLALGS